MLVTLDVTLGLSQKKKKKFKLARYKKSVELHWKPIDMVSTW